MSVNSFAVASLTPGAGTADAAALNASRAGAQAGKAHTKTLAGGS